MKDWLWGIFALCLVLIIARERLDRRNERRSHRQAVSIVQAELAKAKTDVRVDSVDVVRSVTRLKTLRDTLNIHDTLQVLEYITRTDTVIQRCLACTVSASRLRAAADSVDAKWKVAYDAVRPKWTDRVGLSLGYGITKVGSDVKVGPQLGLSVRVFP